MTTHRQSLLKQANEAFRQGDVVKATRYYEKLLQEESPLRSQALFNMGLIEKKDL